MNRRDVFLLTRQWRDAATGIELDLWFSSDEGPLQITIDQQEAVFFVARQTLPQVQTVLSGASVTGGHQTASPALSSKNPRVKKISDYRVGDVTLRNCFDEAVAPLYFKSYRDARDAGDLLERQGISHWEVDIKPTDRYLMERFITGGAQLHLPNHQSNAFRNSRITPSEYRPQLTVCSLDIETSMDAKQLFSIAVYTKHEQKIFVVGQYDNPASNVQICNNQRDCLQRFLHWLEKTDPDVLIGWSVVQFDLWVLENLCRQENIAFTLGRNRQKPHWREDTERERHYLQISGRVALDGIELLRAANYTFTSFSLENVSRELLGEGKLAHGSGRVEDIQQWFLHDKNQLAKYNLQDCKLVWDIFEQESLIDFAIERAHLTGLALDRSGGSVAAFEYAYLPLLHRKGYVAPNLGEIESDIVSPGGYVMDSVPGIFNHVLVLDFKSLYPSIIRTFCIDPYAYWYAQHHTLEPQSLVPGFHEATFSKTEKILPDVIEKLWQARDKAKAEKNQPLSHAIKIIMNSFYGVLGSTGCRFYDPRVCSSITLRGHEIIQQTKQCIEAEGYQVIYGDTDSVFVWVGDNPGIPPDSIGQHLSEKLNSFWGKKLKKEFAIDSALEIEYETHYHQFLMPTIRNSTEGSKKRYAGVVEKNGKSQLIFKGLENVRTDWTALAKQFQETLYRMVFEGAPVENYIRDTVAKVLAGEMDKELIYRKRLRRKLVEYSKNVPPHIQAARKLLDWKGELLRRGDWIEYIITVNGPEPIKAQRSHVNYQHYIDRQLLPVADGVLQFINLSFTEIAAPQLGLF